MTTVSHIREGFGHVAGIMNIFSHLQLLGYVKKENFTSGLGISLKFDINR